MYRKPIFDAVKLMLKRGFSQAEVDALDHACDLAEAAVEPPSSAPSKPKPAVPGGVAAATAHVLGGLSAEFESGNNGPGTVSSGVGDPGGVSYGTYQLASKTGTCAAFVKAEGKPWTGNFVGLAPGSPGFSAAWKAIAKAEPAVFGNAQHAFIERLMYRPVVKAVADRKGIDLDKRHDAVRDAVWSCAVQHGKASLILIDAIDNLERDTGRDDANYDRKLVDAIYKARIAYVLEVAKNKKLQAQRDQLVSITKNRYPKELAKALDMFDGPAAPATAPTPAPATPATDGSIDGNVVAKAAGVAVKNANVKISRLDPKMEAVIHAVAKCAKEMGTPPPVITSGNDSKHMSGSLHYSNRALDFRGNNVKVTVGQSLAARVAAELGGEYDVAFEVFENPANNHLHVEYDPT